MPNGGGDNCGTCWLYRANEGRPRYEPPYATGSVCNIRGLVIEDPLYTYCANHQLHAKIRIGFPIGPVYAGYMDFGVHLRVVLAKSPDTEPIRRRLLGQLRRARLAHREVWPSFSRFNDEVVKQLGAFRDNRAIHHLRRLARSNPFRQIALGRQRGLSSNRPFRTVALAVDALAAITGDNAYDYIQRLWRTGRRLLTGAQTLVDRGQSETDTPLTIAEAVRFAAVLALRHCTKGRAAELAHEAEHDPDSNIAKLVRDLVGTSADGPSAKDLQRLYDEWNEFPATNWEMFLDWRCSIPVSDRRPPPPEALNALIKDLPAVEEDDNG